MRYFEDYDDAETDKNCAKAPETEQRNQRLVQSIDLRELVRGKDIVFQVSEDYDDFNICEDNFGQSVEEFSDITTMDKLGASRGAPDPDLPFESVGVSMVNLDESGLIKKEIISKGSGGPPPPDSKVTVHYNFYKQGECEPFDSTYLRGKPSKLRLGQGEVIPGLETAIKSMRRNENSRFILKWQVAFGQQGCPPRIGKECDILVDITLLDYEEIICFRDDDGLTEQEMRRHSFDRTMKEAKSCHCSGNDEYKSGNIKGAIGSYKKCVKMLNDVRLTNQEEENKMLALKVKCLVNLAICYNKLGRSEKACVTCREALAIDENNVKAAFQYGKANIILSNFELAEKWLKRAKRLKADDEDINRELEKLREKKKNAYLTDTLFCKKAFGCGEKLE